MGSNGDDHLLKHPMDEGVSRRQEFGRTGDVIDIGKPSMVDKEKSEQLDHGSLKEAQNQKKSEQESSQSKELKVSSSPRRG